MNKLPFIFVFAFLFIICAGVGVSAIGTYPAVDPNMVLYYHFNNNSAIGENQTKIVDSSLVSNNATQTNAVFNSSGGYLNDGSWEFNGINSAVNVSPFLSQTRGLNSSSFSLSFWFKYYSNQSGVQGNGLINQRTAQNRLALFIYTNSSINVFGKLELVIWNSTNSQSGAIRSNADFNQTDTWYYVTIVYNSNNNQVDFYKNGQLLNSVTSTVTLNTNYTGDIEIGRALSGVNYRLNGTIDDFIYYNKTMTPNVAWNNYYSYIGCLTPYQGISIYGDSQFCNGNYSFNNSGVASITVGASNVVINANGSNFYGNWTLWNTGTYPRLFDLNGKSNVTITNFSATGFYFSARALNAINYTLSYHSTDMCYDNIILQNMTNVYLQSIVINRTQDIGLKLTDILYLRAFNITSLNSNISNGLSDIYSQNTTHSLFDFITIFNQTGSLFPATIVEQKNATNITIQNSFLYSGYQACTIYHNNVRDLIINRNYCVGNDHYGFDSYDNVSNIIVSNNIINASGGISGAVAFNSRENLGLPYPSWDNRGGNFTSMNNTVYEGTTAISFSGSNGGRSINDVVYNSLEGGSADYARNIFYYNFSAYNVKQCLRISNASYNIYVSNLSCINANKTFSIGMDYNSTNLTVVDSMNFYGANVSLYTNYTNPYYFFNTNFSNVSGFSFFIPQQRGLQISLVYQRYGYFQANNTDSIQITLINNSNFKYGIYYNGTFLCNNCSDNYNLNISPGNSFYISNEPFTISEANSGAYIPVWFSSSTATEKHIASNLSQSVNATVIINVEDCDNTLSLTVKGTTTGYSQTYTKGQFTCSEGLATIPSTMIENSTQSTIITINTEFDSVTSSPYCRTLTGSLGDFGAMFAIIIIALILGFVYFALVRQELITEVISAGVIVLVMAAIILIIGGIVIGGLC